MIAYIFRRLVYGVFVLAGVRTGQLPGMDSLPLPVLDAKRHSVEELVQSDVGKPRKK